MTTSEMLDAYEQTTDPREADLYMGAYAALYGCDSAPFWAHRYPEYVAEGVECWQECENH